MSKLLSSDSMLLGFAQGTISVDPSVLPGVAAPIGAILPRSGSPELWQKYGSGDTDWRLVGQSGNYASGSLLIATASHRMLSNHLILNTTQRATVRGTGRLVIKT
jgi:hypothetical protein